jgi:hypothetical protein
VTPAPHLVVVEAYDGMLEFLSADTEERAAARGLGLPLEAIAERLGSRITVLTWGDWLEYETNPATFFHWMLFPATRALAPPGPARDEAFAGGRVVFRPIPARDPGHGEPLHLRPPSPLTLGLLANSDPLFLLSYCLQQFLEALLAADPFQAVVVPMWGGAGYVAQMARATGASALAEVPFVSVVTDNSSGRHRVNGDGLWTRPGITRRQMEEVSLALADLTIVYGHRGERLALEGRLPEAPPPVLAPRHVPESVLQRMVAAAGRPPGSERVEFFLSEPQDPASGVLTALDAVAELSRREIRLAHPIVSAGPDTRFAPMKPREFTRYWSSRGFVRELVSAGYWTWASRYEAPLGTLPARLYPSTFEHLPAVWAELDRGSMVFLSAAAAEGLLPGSRPPSEALLGDEPTPTGVADAIARWSDAAPARLDSIRRELCASVAASHRGPERARLLEATVEALHAVLEGRSAPPKLDRAALLLLDRTKPLRSSAGSHTWSAPAVGSGSATATLSVVVVCHNMGPLITETVESVWRSEFVPDEVLLVDDGSDDAETAIHLAALERAAVEHGRPLRIVRQRNLGLAAARNAGLNAATGEFISFLDGDDLIEPTFYRLAFDVLRRNPGLGGVAAWAFCFGEGVPDGFWNAPQPEFPLLLVENTVIVPCLTHTALLRELGGYDGQQRYNYEDWELSVRLLESGRPLVTIPQYLQRYRMRPESLYRTMTDAQNQSMRELMLSRHRETTARFAMEVAMQLEHRLMQRVYATPAPAVPMGARQLGRALLAALGRRLQRRLAWARPWPRR